MPTKALTKSALLQVIAQKTDTDRKTAGFFLDVITEIAPREVKKAGELTFPVIPIRAPPTSRASQTKKPAFWYLMKLKLKNRESFWMKCMAFASKHDPDTTSAVEFSLLPSLFTAI